MIYILVYFVSLRGVIVFLELQLPLVNYVFCVVSMYIIIGTTMDHGVDQKSRKDGALVIVLPRWNANPWLYLAQARPGA